MTSADTIHRVPRLKHEELSRINILRSGLAALLGGNALAATLAAGAEWDGDVCEDYAMKNEKTMKRAPNLQRVVRRFCELRPLAS